MINNWIYKIIFLFLLLINISYISSTKSYAITMHFSNAKIITSQDIDQYIWICEQYLKKGRFNKAFSIAQKLIKRENNNVKAHAILAAYYKGLDITDKFNKEVTVIKKLTPNLSILYIMLGHTYLGLNRYKIAENMYKKAVMLDKHSVKARLELTNFYIHCREFKKAHDEYKKIINNYKLSTQQFLVINLKLCRLNFNLKRYNENITICKKLINLYPKFPGSYIYLSDSYLAKGQPNLAINNYKLLIKLLPNYVEAYQKLTLVYIDVLNDKSEALNYIKKAIDKFPNNARNYDILGWIYYKNANYSQALKCFKTASNLDKNSIYLYHLGMTYKKMSNLLQAKKAFKQAIKYSNFPKSSKLYRQIRNQLNDI